MPRKSINLLTDTAIRRIKSTDKTIMKADGNGLYLAVTSSGNKIWRLKCRLGQSSITQTLGHYPATSRQMVKKPCTKGYGATVRLPT